MTHEWGRADWSKDLGHCRRIALQLDPLGPGLQRGASVSQRVSCASTHRLLGEHTLAGAASAGGITQRSRCPQGGARSK